MKKKQLNAKQKRETKLWFALQRSHGYTMQELPKGQRVQMMFVKDKRETSKSRVVPVVCVKLAVPSDSMLGGLLTEMRKTIADVRRKR